MGQLDRSEAKKFLIIEDNHSDMKLLKKTIENKHPEVQISEAYSLSEAYADHRTKKYDLVLVDLNLPDGFGLATIKEVKRYLGDHPIIAVTGALNQTIENKASEMGAQGIVSKDNIMDQTFYTILERYTSVH